MPPKPVSDEDEKDAKGVENASKKKADKAQREMDKINKIAAAAAENAAAAVHAHYAALNHPGAQKPFVLPPDMSFLGEYNTGDPLALIGWLRRFATIIKKSKMPADVQISQLANRATGPHRDDWFSKVTDWEEQGKSFSFITEELVKQYYKGPKTIDDAMIKFTSVRLLPHEDLLSFIDKMDSAVRLCKSFAPDMEDAVIIRQLQTVLPANLLHSIKTPTIDGGFKLPETWESIKLLLSQLPYTPDRNVNNIDHTTSTNTNSSRYVHTSNKPSGFKSGKKHIKKYDTPKRNFSPSTPNNIKSNKKRKVSPVRPEELDLTCRKN